MKLIYKPINFLIYVKGYIFRLLWNWWSCRNIDKFKTPFRVRSSLV